MIPPALTTMALAIAIAGSATFAQQADITWSSSYLATNLDSTGAPFDDSFSFYLGVFNPPSQTPPWTPNDSNTADWASYWITADVASYDPILNFRFASGYNLEPTVDGVNLTGKKGYIWGVTRNLPGEWILITAPSWIWPSDGGLTFPQNWTVNTGTAVLGAINTGGVHMRSAAVTEGRPPRLHPDMWRRLHFTPFEIASQESTVSGWLADPNHNGRTNAVEYALGSPPRSSRPHLPTVVGSTQISGAEFLTLTVRRDPNTTAIMTPLISDNLATWSGGPSHLALVSESPASLVFRDLVPIGISRSRFLRLEVVLPAPP